MLLATMTLLVPAMGRLDAQVTVPLGVPRLVLAPGVTRRSRSGAGSDSPTRGCRSPVGSWDEVNLT
jgi:hypothetical protein